jgi:uncharacterized membrane protein
VKREMRKQNGVKGNLNAETAVQPKTTTNPRNAIQRIGSLRVAQIAVFSALIVVGTSIARIPLPPPIYEITLAPAFYLAISILFPRNVSFWSIALGSAIGETINLVVTPAPLIYIPGIIWARAPEALIIYKFREKSVQWVTVAMVLATIYETVAFLVPDGLFYSYSLFSYGNTATGLTAGFSYAFFSDIFTLVDLVWIPVALGIIAGVRKTFNIRFFE